MPDGHTPEATGRRRHHPSSAWRPRAVLASSEPLESDGSSGAPSSPLRESLPRLYLLLRSGVALTESVSFPGTSRAWSRFPSSSSKQGARLAGNPYLPLAPRRPASPEATQGKPPADGVRASSATFASRGSQPRAAGHSQLCCGEGESDAGTSPTRRSSSAAPFLLLGNGGTSPSPLTETPPPD